MPDTDLALLMDRFMRRIHFGLQAKAPGFDPDGVGPGGGILLLTIEEMGCPEVNALTRRIARDKSQMSRMLKSLERKGLVARETSPRDARVSLVSLTPAGRDAVSRIQTAVAETIDGILDPITGEEKQALKQLLRRALG